MATTTLTAYTVDYNGVSLTSGTAGTHIQTVATAGTIVVDTDDFSKLFVRLANINSTTSYSLTLESDGDFSDQLLGDVTLSLATSGTLVLGGLASSRYKTSGGTLIITVPTGGNFTVEAGLMSLES